VTDYRDLLLAERQAIHRRRNAQRACLRIELTSDALEAMRDATERDTAAAQLSGDALRLHEIDAALAKIGTPEWGKCEDCDCEISEKRLAAVPHARRCVTCQVIKDNWRAFNAAMDGEAA
jgi:RNA polymerase-binding transcription factor DksA